MTEFVEYLINIASYIYTTLYLNWGGQVETAQFDLAYAWILGVIFIAFVFIFSMIPTLFKLIFSLLGRLGRGE